MAATGGGGGGATTPDWQSLAAVQLTSPQDFGTGAFSYQVGIEVPPFRGLEPGITLSYQSGAPLQYSGNGAGWMGIGWRLDGVPTIERGLRGGGSPAFTTPYSAGGDIFLLGGEELILCQSGTVSPSCATGGTHATRIESYRRVSYSSVTNYWSVTDRDGTVYEFRPTVETQPVDPSDPIAVQLANDYRWLLRTVTDARGNQITYNYDCYQAAYCRIITIAYGGAEIQFYWESRPDQYRYATGLNTITVEHRLRTVDVKFGGNRVRTYALSYNTSQVVGISRLASVRQWPSDAIVDSNGAVSSGGTSPLPATSFNYRAEASSFGSNRLVAEDVLALGDFDGDGRTDVYTLEGDIEFGNGTTLSVGPMSDPPEVYVQAGDINGDGRDDLFAGIVDDEWNFRFSPGFGLSSRDIDIEPGEGEIGDFNGDGRADIFSADRDIIYIGNANNTLTKITTGISIFQGLLL